MAARPERRSRRGTGGQNRAALQGSYGDSSTLLSTTSAMDAKATGEALKAKSETLPADVSILHLLGGIPSPARPTAAATGHPLLPAIGQLGTAQPQQPQGIPCCPPPHAPMPLTMPAGPPPPPLAPAINCESGASYRERLRAGGQGAFQRAFDIGLMPKQMKNDWNGARPSEIQGMLPQQTDMQSNMMMPCMAGGDTQQAWHGTGQMQNHDYWYVPVDQPQMSTHCPYTEQVSMAQMPQTQDMYQMTMPDHQSMMAMPDQQPVLAMPDQQPMLTMPPQAMLQQPMMPTTPMNDEATDFQRCLAIIMPDAAQVPCDKDLLAAQLRAVADCQCYED